MFKCTWEDCDKEFKQSTSLKIHIRRHTGEKPYKCIFDNCNKSFCESGDLRKHEKIHTIEKPYICDFNGCEKSFSFLNNLVVHKRIHNGQRPYKCNFDNCNFSFIQLHHLKNHERIHTGEKPYKCDYDKCDKVFTKNNSLIIHKRIHTGEKPYVCKECDQTFSRTHHLKDHIKRWHTKEGQQVKKKSEEYTAKLLEKEGIDFKREHQVSFSCNGGTFCRIDYLHIKNGIIFAIEYQHNGYPLSCEMRRMMDVKSVFVQEGNEMPLVWIRYNPDSFVKGETKVKINKKDRIKKVINLINKLSEVPEDVPLLSIYYCFYDTYDDGSLCILDDIDFDITLKAMSYCIN
jgi:hypothetical protein